MYIGLNPSEYPASVPRLLARALYRWRWQLTPAFVALAVPVAGWTLAIVRATAGRPWAIAVLVVAVVCAGSWMAFGMRRPYDRAYALLATVATLGLTYAIALHPGYGALYGVLALGWPILGLGWWCGQTFRSAISLDRTRRRWNSVADLAGIPGAILTAARSTPVGRVLTVKLPGNHTARDVNRERVESGYQLRPGSVTVVRDKANARRVDLHIVDRDPWESNRVVDHPALVALVAESNDSDVTVEICDPTVPKDDEEAA